MRFITEHEEDILRDYYFNEDNEVEDKLTEQGFTDWMEGLSWIEIDDIVGEQTEEYE